MSLTEGGSAGLLNSDSFKPNYFLSLLIRRKRSPKSVCFAYSLPPLLEPRYFHKTFKASELLRLMETLPSELMARTQPQLPRSSSPRETQNVVTTEGQRSDSLQAWEHWRWATQPQRGDGASSWGKQILPGWLSAKPDGNNTLIGVGF